MAAPRACRSPCRSPPLVGEDNLVGAIPTEGSGTPTPTLVMSYGYTPAPAAAFALPFASAATDLVAKYSTKDL